MRPVRTVRSAARDSVPPILRARMCVASQWAASGSAQPASSQATVAGWVVAPKAPWLGFVRKPRSVPVWGGPAQRQPIAVRRGVSGRFVSSLGSLRALWPGSPAPRLASAVPDSARTRRTGFVGVRCSVAVASPVSCAEWMATVAAFCVWRTPRAFCVVLPLLTAWPAMRSPARSKSASPALPPMSAVLALAWSLLTVPVAVRRRVPVGPPARFVVGTRNAVHTPAPKVSMAWGAVWFPMRV